VLTIPRARFAVDVRHKIEWIWWWEYQHETGGELEPDKCEDYRREVEWLFHLRPVDLGDGVERFGCDLLDEATGRCTVYENRPKTCREYPAHEPANTCRGCGFVAPPLTPTPVTP
jgi:Fe-S-cluster containining protein